MHVGKETDKLMDGFKGDLLSLIPEVIFEGHHHLISVECYACVVVGGHGHS